MALTYIAIRQAKPKDLVHFFFDGGGLFLSVSPSGSRLWRLAYRFAGETKHPSGLIPLFLSRTPGRSGTKQTLSHGEDPAVVKRKEKSLLWSLRETRPASSQMSTSRGCGRRSS